MEGVEVGVVGVLDQRHYSLHCSMSPWTGGRGRGGGGRAEIGVGSWWSETGWGQGEEEGAQGGRGGGEREGRRGGRLATAEEVTYPPPPPQLYLLPEPITVAEIPQD